MRTCSRKYNPYIPASAIYSSLLGAFAFLILGNAMDAGQISANPTKFPVSEANFEWFAKTPFLKPIFQSRERTRSFHKSCIKHSECYMSLGAKRSLCDYKLKRNLNRLYDYKSSHKNFDNRLCHQTTEANYVDVRRKGGQIFESAQKKAESSRNYVSGIINDQYTFLSGDRLPPHEIDHYHEFLKNNNLDELKADLISRFGEQIIRSAYFEGLGISLNESNMPLYLNLLAKYGVSSFVYYVIEEDADWIINTIIGNLNGQNYIPQTTREDFKSELIASRNIASLERSINDYIRSKRQYANEQGFDRTEECSYLALNPWAYFNCISGEHIK